MRRLRIAPPAQLSLDLAPDPGQVGAEDRWQSLPEPAKTAVLAVLARLIARGITVEGPDQRARA